MKKFISFIGITTGFVLLLLLTASSPKDEADSLIALEARNLPQLCECATVPVMLPIIPPDVATMRQPCFDCFGWQMFVAMNWLADPLRPGVPDSRVGARQFGTPGDYRPVVWQTYKDVFDVFKDEPPGPWNEGVGKTKMLGMVDKTTAKNQVGLWKQSDLHWLTDWNNNLVYYEITLNQDEFNYIVANKLYSKQGLHEFASKNTFDLPDQRSEYGSVGIIEIKAAWKMVKPEELADMSRRYKISKYDVLQPNDSIIESYMALVGLHIAKKTPKTPQWTWATFEHVENAPDKEKAASASGPWNFFDPDAPADYKPNWNDPPDKYSDPSMKKPVQVVRAVPIRDHLAQINSAMHALIKLNNGNSVFQYYDLVDVQWPTRPERITGPRTRMLPDGRSRPEYVCNVTMETYMQGPNTGGGGPNMESSCIGCHRQSCVTPDFADIGKTGTWFTDYSTLFFKVKKHKE